MGSPETGKVTSRPAKTGAMLPRLSSCSMFQNLEGASERRTGKQNTEMKSKVPDVGAEILTALLIVVKNRKQAKCPALGA